LFSIVTPTVGGGNDTEGNLRFPSVGLLSLGSLALAVHAYTAH
jgi:hypothetical protein